jgi:DeoR family transcriptional regulator, L-fucose operon activator
VEKKRRQEEIVEYLENEGASTYPELVKRLRVSNMTVRRDVEQLAHEGKVIKTLGGVQKAHAPSHFYESPVLSHFAVNRTEKQLIAQEAMRRLEPRQTIYLDGSSTCLELAKLIARKTSGLTIVTNSVLVCLESARQRENTVICLGGQHDPVSFCLTGRVSEEDAHHYFVDRAFMSTKGFLPAEGTFESSVATFRIKQLMAHQCSELVLLVDHSKFGQRALCKVLDISEINVVITDDKTAEGDIALLKNRVGAVLIASGREALEGAGT